MEASPINRLITGRLREDLQRTRVDLNELEKRQDKIKAQVFDLQDANQALISAEVAIDVGNFVYARANLAGIQREMQDWKSLLEKQERARAQALSQANQVSNSSSPAMNAYLQTIPILMYHKTPANFASQLDTITQKGYQTVTLDEVANALKSKQPLTGKPIVITFDDGFKDQWKAYEALRARSMKATFYIITGGEASRGCIGANRTNTTCGDDYLSWDQIRELDSSGLITIGNHTVDHLGLGGQTEAVADFQIREAQAELTRQLGKTIRHFAYPYGSFNATSIKLVRKYGFTTAVSTQQGIQQSPDWLYNLHRTRSVDQLP